MGKIIVWNTYGDNDYSEMPTNFYVGRSAKYSSPLGNPYTHNGKRSNLAKLTFRTREEAIAAYELYFDESYGKDPMFTEAFDKIYDVYKSGQDVYLQCFCHPKPCHADVIARKLQQKLIKDKAKEILKKKDCPLKNP